MRSTRKTVLGFGMVSIPVSLYKITEERTLEKNIHQVHGACGSRIKMPKYCPTCEKQIEVSELVKGYFYDKEHYISLTEQDYDLLPLSSLKSIAIEGFVPPIDDRRWFNGGLYGIAPDEVGAKAFVLFMKAMNELGVWGIAKMASHEKEQLVAISPSGDGILYLQTLHWGNELRDYGEIIPYADVSEKEMEMGKALISAMSKHLDLSAFQDEYGLALRDLISAKLEGKELAPPPEAKKPAGDLVEQLMASLQAMAKTTA